MQQIARTNAAPSANNIAHQIPDAPNIIGNNKINAIWKTSVRINAFKADKAPLLSAVKKELVKMPIPVNKNPSEHILKALAVNFSSSALPLENNIASGLAQVNEINTINNSIIVIMIKLFLKTFFNSL